MKITLQQNRYDATLIVDSGNAKISEDITEFSTKTGRYTISETIVEEFFTLAFDAAGFNEKSNVDTLKLLFENFLSDEEKEDFIGILNQEK